MDQTPTPDSPLPADEELPSTPTRSFEAVPLRQRADGWTPELQHRFIEIIADTGSVRDACMMVGMSRQSAYALRRHPDGAAFAAAWHDAIANATRALTDEAFDRAMNGSVTRIVKDGVTVGQRVVHSDRLLMFLLRTHASFQYGDYAKPLKFDQRIDWLPTYIKRLPAQLARLLGGADDKPVKRRK